jgi:hypothetical protein
LIRNHPSLTSTSNLSELLYFNIAIVLSSTELRLAFEEVNEERSALRSSASLSLLLGLSDGQGSFEAAKRLWEGILPRCYSGRAKRNRRIESCVLCGRAQLHSTSVVAVAWWSIFAVDRQWHFSIVPSGGS